LCQGFGQIYIALPGGAAALLDSKDATIFSPKAGYVIPLGSIIRIDLDG
jgi:hypothetical protein